MTDDTCIRGLNPADVWDQENGFYWFSEPKRLGKLLAHYELYKRITGLPGHCVECGVYKAASLIRFATFRRLLETPDSRGIFAFDAFGAFPKEGVTKPSDQNFIARFEDAGGAGLSLQEVQSVLSRKHLNENLTLIEGDVRETIPTFLGRRPEFRVALLHLDLDVYEPTKASIDAFWDRLVPGGILVIDDYNAVAGATTAIDEMMVARPGLKVEKLSCSHIPAFVVKP